MAEHQSDRSETTGSPEDAAMAADYAAGHEELVHQLDETLEQVEELAVLLHRCCQQVVHAIPGTDQASITLLRDAGPYTAAATDDRAGELDAANTPTGRGPVWRRPHQTAGAGRDRRCPAPVAPVAPVAGLRPGRRRGRAGQLPLRDHRTELAARRALGHQLGIGGALS